MRRKRTDNEINLHSLLDHSLLHRNPNEIVSTLNRLLYTYKLLFIAINSCSIN